MGLFVCVVISEGAQSWVSLLADLFFFFFSLKRSGHPSNLGRSECWQWPESPSASPGMVEQLLAMDACPGPLKRREEPTFLPFPVKEMQNHPFLAARINNQLMETKDSGLCLSMAQQTPPGSEF